MFSENVSSADNQQERPILKQKLKWESSETTRQISQFDKSLATLLGMLYTDGCVSPRHKASWRLYFSATSFVLVNNFKMSIIDVFNVDPKRVRSGLNKENLYVAVLDSKEVGAFLTSRFGTFRTLKYKDGSVTNAHLPIRELISLGCVKEFLRAAFSCDGGVSFYPVVSNNTSWLNRCVFLACDHDRLRKDYESLLIFLGIGCKNDPRDKKIRITSKPEIERFKNNVNFIEGVQVTSHSKIWKGVSKSNVLKHLLLSYKEPSKYLRNFKVNN